MKGMNDTTGVSAFGRMCLKMMPGSDTPAVIAAPT
jgi:hypothetical protein